MCCVCVRVVCMSINHACMLCVGFLSITGRIKEIIVTKGGENVAPLPIESVSF